MKVIRVASTNCAPLLDTAPRIPGRWKVTGGTDSRLPHPRVEETQDALVYDTGSVPDSSRLPVTIPAAIEPLTKYLYQVMCATSGRMRQQWHPAFWVPSAARRLSKWITGTPTAARDVLYICAGRLPPAGKRAAGHLRARPRSTAPRFRPRRLPHITSRCSTAC